MITDNMIDDAIIRLELTFDHDETEQYIQEKYNLNNYDAQVVVEMAEDAISEG